MGATRGDAPGREFLLPAVPLTSSLSQSHLRVVRQAQMSGLLGLTKAIELFWPFRRICGATPSEEWEMSLSV